MKDFFSKVVEASGEQWLGFISLFFVSALLALSVFAIGSDHSVNCNYIQTYQVDGFTQYRVMNDINWMTDTKAFSSLEADKTLLVFDKMPNKCPSN
jgi:hypothetical protein